MVSVIFTGSYEDRSRENLKNKSFCNCRIVNVRWKIENGETAYISDQPYPYSQKLVGGRDYIDYLTRGSLAVEQRQ